MIPSMKSPVYVDGRLKNDAPSMKMPVSVDGAPKVE
jgi:hypothetical protein